VLQELKTVLLPHFNELDNETVSNVQEWVKKFAVLWVILYQRVETNYTVSIHGTVMVGVWGSVCESRKIHLGVLNVRAV
jgi:hypothetical protein